jgi:hypothetical protein
VGFDLCALNVPAAWLVGTPEDGGFNGYYRYNAWGMGRVRSVLERAGVLSWEEPELGTPEGPTDEDDRALSLVADDGRVGGWKLCDNTGYVVVPDECRKIAATIREQVDRELIVEAIRGDDAARAQIYASLSDPGHQLAREAREQAERGPDPDEVDFWLEELPRFASYCERAAECGGFRVC